MNSAGAAPRVDWVDYAKGICIIMVVMMHSTLGVEKAVEAEGWMHYVVAFARPFRMPDFFLISGLFLNRVIDRNWRTYADRKVVHFVYFYVLWLMIQGLFRWPVLAMEEGGGAVVHAVLLAFIEPFGTLWFIYILPIFFVTAKLVRRVPPVLVLAVAAALEMAPIETHWVVIDEFANRIVFFLLGWYAAPQIFAFAGKVSEHPRAAVLGLVLWALIDVAAVWGGVSEWPVVSLVLGLMGALAIISVAALIATADVLPLLRYAGEHSIAVYLAFFLPMVVTRTVLLKTGVISDIGTVSLIVTVIAASLPLVFYWLVTRTGWCLFLFERPAAFRIDQPRPRPVTPVPHPFP
jgi:uncharacterized membrane protein YcfT